MSELIKYFDNQTIDSALLNAINFRYEKFKESKCAPEKILFILKEIMIDPGVVMAFEKRKNVMSEITQHTEQKLSEEFGEMSEDKPMTIGQRIRHIKDEIIKSKKNLEEVKQLGGHSCYAAGFEEGIIGALVDELYYLEGLYNGDQAS